MLRRLLLDHDEFRGEVIFTFDGDEAGQKAALRAFEGDQQFVGADLRRGRAGGPRPVRAAAAEGDAAVRELVARRVPLYRFVLGNVARRYDLDRRTAGSTRSARRHAWSSSIRDRSKVEAFAREVAGMVGRRHRGGPRRGPQRRSGGRARRS